MPDSPPKPWGDRQAGRPFHRWKRILQQHQQPSICRLQQGKSAAHPAPRSRPHGDCGRARLRPATAATELLRGPVPPLPSAWASSTAIWSGAQRGTRRKPSPAKKSGRESQEIRAASGRKSLAHRYLDGAGKVSTGNTGMHSKSRRARQMAR